MHIIAGTPAGQHLPHVAAEAIRLQMLPEAVSPGLIPEQEAPAQATIAVQTITAPVAEVLLAMRLHKGLPVVAMVPVVAEAVVEVAVVTVAEAAVLQGEAAGVPAVATGSQVKLF